MTSEVFQKTVADEFLFAKSASSLIELWQRSLELPSGGCLIPLSHIHLPNDQLIDRLGEWRASAANAYPTRFPVTREGTRRWAQQGVLETPDRLLFLIHDEAGGMIGHCGLAHGFNDAGIVELDNVLRGEASARKGIMREAVEAVEKWAFGVLFAKGIVLRVLASNPHAVKFYETIGYAERERQPLKLIVSGVTESLVPAEAGESADDSFVLMESVTEKRTPNELILTAGPSIGFREQTYSADAVRNGWNTKWNKYLSKFEEAFAEYTGTEYAIATSSCTGALHIALAALGIGPDDEVIVPDVTWVATANAVRYVGATPVFADVDPRTWCIDALSAQALITPRTRAIIPVHLYGHPADMDPILALATRHDLFVVEDAAPSIGAEYKGRRTGSFGHFAAFSFQGAKLTVTGEGGMLVTRDETLYKRAHAIWDQGREPGTFWITTNGLKYKMSNAQAAIGLGQLERNNAMIEKKRMIFDWYRENLWETTGVELFPEAAWARSIYSMTSIQLTGESPITRDELITKLREKKVDTRPVFPAISQYPIWPIRQTPTVHGSRIGSSGINLPSGVRLSKSEVDYVSEQVISLL